MENKIKFSGRSAEVLYMAELLESVPMVNRLGSQIRQLYAMTPSRYRIDIILEYDMLCALKEVFKAIGKEVPDVFPSYVSIDYDENSYKELTKDLIFSIENIATLYKIPEKSFMKILRDWLINHSKFIYCRKDV